MVDGGQRFMASRTCNKSSQHCHFYEGKILFIRTLLQKYFNTFGIPLVNSMDAYLELVQLNTFKGLIVLHKIMMLQLFKVNLKLPV